MMGGGGVEQGHLGTRLQLVDRAQVVASPAASFSHCPGMVREGVGTKTEGQPQNQSSSVGCPGNPK